MNMLVLSALLAERQALRYTPAGIPVLALTLQHSSAQTAATQAVTFEMTAMIFGDAALLAQALQPNVSYVFRGYLAPKRKDGVQLVLHVSSWEQAS